MATDRPRATIIETGDRLVVAAEIEIAATPREIFDLLADPEKHSLFDGSKTVQRALSGPKRLYQGAKFAMAMKIKLPYRITNEVVTFEEDREIAWRHLMKLCRAHWPPRRPMRCPATHLMPPMRCLMQACLLWPRGL